MIRKKNDLPSTTLDNCHDGIGTLLCRSMLQQGDSDYGIMFFHHDIIPPGVTVGEHLHSGNEEIYYLLKGSCTLLYDGESMPMTDGDISVVRSGHTHGIINTGESDAELIVVGVTKEG